MPVFSSPIDIGLEIDTVSQVVSCRVFETAQQTVVRRAVKIEPLLPRDLASIAHVPEAEQSMLLVASAFLTLTVFVNVMSEPAIASAVKIVADGAFKELTVVTENGNGHHRFDCGNIPVAICRWREIEPFAPGHCRSYIPPSNFTRVTSPGVRIPEISEIEKVEGSELLIGVLVRMRRGTPHSD